MDQGTRTFTLQDIEKTQQTTVDYPILADKDRRVAKLYGMLDASAGNGDLDCQNKLMELGFPLLSVQSLSSIPSR